MERNIVDKPLVLPISTPLGYYIYETNRNEVISVSKEMFSYIQAIMGNNASEISRTSDNVKTQYAELAGCGYFSPPRVEKVEHPATYHLKHYLARNIEKFTLQITQNCNLRCKYCIYSEDSNLSQRSHSSNKMTFDIAKKALDFYWEHSRDSKSVMVGLYGGEPLLEYPLIVEIVKYAESIFAGKALSFGVKRARVDDAPRIGVATEPADGIELIINLPLSDYLQKRSNAFCEDFSESNSVLVPRICGILAHEMMKKQIRMTKGEAISFFSRIGQSSVESKFALPQRVPPIESESLPPIVFFPKRADHRAQMSTINLLQEKFEYNGYPCSIISDTLPSSDFQ